MRIEERYLHGACIVIRVDPTRQMLQGVSAMVAIYNTHLVGFSQHKAEIQCVICDMLTLTLPEL